MDFSLKVLMNLMVCFKRFLSCKFWAVLYCYHIGQSYLKPMYAVVLIWFYVVMHTEGSFDYLLLGGSLPPIKGCFLNMIPAFIQTERQIWLLAAALEIVLFHSDLIIVQRLY